MKYYLVKAKCGHVGKGKYLEVDFPIRAETMSDAAQMCLQRPKVKRHLKNAISSVCEIPYDDYLEMMNTFLDNSYVRSHTKKEVLPWLDQVQSLDFGKKRKRSFTDRAERINYIMKKNKLKEDYGYV